jgi:hypothetical protein
MQAAARLASTAPPPPAPRTVPTCYAPPAAPGILLLWLVVYLVATSLRQPYRQRYHPRQAMDARKAVVNRAHAISRHYTPSSRLVTPASGTPPPGGAAAAGSVSTSAGSAQWLDAQQSWRGAAAPASGSVRWAANGTGTPAAPPQGEGRQQHAGAPQNGPAAPCAGAATDGPFAQAALTPFESQQR